MRVVQFDEAQPNELQLLSRRRGRGKGGRCAAAGGYMLKWGFRE